MASPKNKREEAVASAPAWHPNFRNYEQLPDLKVVRTAFFINGLAVLAAVGALLYFVYQEFQLSTLREEIENRVTSVERDRRASGQAVATFRQFQAAERQIKEVTDLMVRRHDLSDLLLHLGATLPEQIALTAFDLRPNRIALTATVRGAPSRWIFPMRKSAAFYAMSPICLSSTSSSRIPSKVAPPSSCATSPGGRSFR
jgi:Tfp pilus assembly protein PilN